MKYLYHSSKGGISPQIAAAIHLGVLPREREPTPLEWERVFYRKGFASQDQGGIFLVGKTKAGDEVFILTYPPKIKELALKSAFAALKLLKRTREAVLIDCANAGGAFPAGDKPPAQVMRGIYPLLLRLVRESEGGCPP